MINEKELNISNTSPIQKDFYQIYPDILEIASEISNRWDPASSNEGDPGVVLLKLLAFIADKNNYIIDKSILEAFMPSATQEDSMRKLCDMMGYEMKYYNSATTDVTFTYYGQTDDNGADKLEDKSFTLDKFTTVSSENGDINYLTLDPVVIDLGNRSKTVKAIEGTLCDLTVGDSKVVKIDNLDSLNRLYLPETMIAQNGVFVNNVGDEEEWERVDNLNIYGSGKRIYKFSFDSKKQLPYLTFPQDINDLISNGLTVKYVRTSGVNGNIDSNTLIKLGDRTFIEIDNSTNTIDLSTEESQNSLVITNRGASKNGTNIESIDDAYNSFKKTVGTFQTLVTCRDYANAIYNLVNSYNNFLVSNVQVADIRNHPTRSSSVVTYDDLGLTTLEGVIPESAQEGYEIDSFDLFIYPLGEYYSYFDNYNYKESFKPNFNSMAAIRQDLANYKTLSHNFKVVNEKELYCYKGYYDLKAKITTTYKVNALEESYILKNVYEKLYEEFNSRKVDFGEKIPYDSILKCIESADTRIKNVSLDEPTISISYMLRDREEGVLVDNINRSQYLDMLAKNILAGRISLFSYNKDFEYDYSQSNAVKFGGDLEDEDSKIKYISTKLEIPTTVSNYKLKENEVIQFIAPSFNTFITYPAYINYYLSLSNVSGELAEPCTLTSVAPGSAYYPANQEDLNRGYNQSGTYIPYYYRVPTSRNVGYLVGTDGTNNYAYISASNTTFDPTKNYYLNVSVDDTYGQDAEVPSIEKDKEYKLQNEDRLYINYVDSNDVEQNIIYDKDGRIVNGVRDEELSFTIIKPNFDLKDSSKEKAFENKLWKKTSGFSASWGIQGMFALESNEQIETRYPVKTTFQNTSILAYWSLNNEDNKFDWQPEGSDYYYILKDGEYFFYTDTNKTGLVILGSGTKIIAKGYTNLNNYNNSKKIDLDKVSKEGINAFSSDSWITWRVLADQSLIFQEMTLITLTEGDTIVSLENVVVESGDENILNNEWKEIGNATYQFSDGTYDSLPLISVGDNTWKVRSRLDLNVSKDSSQHIINDSDKNIIQKIKLLNKDLTELTEITPSPITEDNLYIQSSELLQMAGGDELDVGIYKIEDDGSTTQLNNLSILSYNYSEPTYNEGGESGEESGDSEEHTLVTGTLNDKYTQIDLSSIFNLVLNVNVPEDNLGLIMFYYTPGRDVEHKASIDILSGGEPLEDLNYIRLYNESDYSYSISLSKGINVIEIKGGFSGKIRVSNNGDYIGTVIMSNPDIINNKYDNEGVDLDFLDITKSEGNLLLNRLKIASNNLFYYNNPIDSSNTIDVDKMSDPEALYDYNNILNDFVISELRTDNFKKNIVLTKASRK